MLCLFCFLFIPKFIFKTGLSLFFFTGKVAIMDHGLKLETGVMKKQRPWPT